MPAGGYIANRLAPRVLGACLTALALLAWIPAGARAGFERDFQVSPGMPLDIELADFTSDGITDVVATGDRSLIAFFEGRPDGTLRPPVSTPGLALGSDLLTDDVNGDGIPDVGVYDEDSGREGVFMLIADGSGGFAVASHLVEPGMASAALGDFDGDSTPDLIANGRAGGEQALLLFAGSGDGAFSEPAAFTGRAGYFDLETGDLDVDGDLDVVTNDKEPGEGGMYDQGVGSFLWSEDGSVQHGDFLRIPLTSPLKDIELGDLNADGVLDVAASETDAGVWTTLGDGMGGFRGLARHPAGDHTDAVDLGDIDGDGALDLVATGGSPDGVTIRFGAGDGRFGERLTLGLNGDGKDVEVDDMNRDGRADLVVYGTPDGVTRIGSVVWTLRQTAGPIDCMGKRASVIGARAKDRLTVPARRDVAAMRRGDDVASMEAGPDFICGAAGSDRLDGGAGSDVLRGGTGDDLLIGGRGRDRCAGGPGEDVLRRCE